MEHTSSAQSIWPHWEPAILLPTQLLPRANPAHSPEMRLVAAILEDAWYCATRQVRARSRRARREFTEAYQWFCDERRDWPFAFSNVCDLLGLDAAVVRRQLRHALPD